MEQVSVYTQRTVRVVPLSRLPVLSDVLMIAVALDIPRERLGAVLGPAHVAVTIPFGDRPCVLAHRRLDFYAEPLSGSRNSDARYWIVHPDPTARTLLLVQYLPPHGKTSTHRHTEEDEWFFSLLGQCTVIHAAPSQPGQDVANVPERAVLHSRRTRGLHVPHGMVHQLETAESPVLNVILICRTAAQSLAELNHCYVHWTEPPRW